MRHIPRATPFSRADVKTCRVEGGRLFGLRRSGGSLVPAYALSLAELENVPASAENMYLSSGGTLYLYGGGAVYRSTGAYANFVKLAEGFTSPPAYTEFFEEYGDILLIYDGQKALKVDASSSAPTAAPQVKNGAAKGFRLFGVDLSDGYAVRWSHPGKSSLWTEELDGGGYIRLSPDGGEVLRVVNCGGRLVAVRRYGLTELGTDGRAQDFHVVRGVLTEESDGVAAPCGGKLYFFASSGLYVYDGEVRAFAREELRGFSSVTDMAAWGNTLLACGSLEGRGVVACIDCKDGTVSYIDGAASCVCAAGRAFCFIAGGVYEIVPAQGGVWECGPCNFSSSARKYLESVDVGGDVQKLTVSCGGRTRTFLNASGNVKVGMRGRRFCFRAECGCLDGLAVNYAERR